MTKRSVLFRGISIALVAPAIVWFFHPYTSPKTALVEPRLVALREPYRAVQSFYFQDGGSVGIRISDANGRAEEFAIASYLGSQERYQRVYVGAIHDRRPGATEVGHPAETKQALIVILSRYSHGDPQLDFATMALSRRPRDYCKVFMHKLAGNYNSP